MTSAKTLIAALIISLGIIYVIIKPSLPSKSIDKQDLPLPTLQTSTPEPTKTTSVYDSQSKEEASVSVTVKPLVLEHGKPPKFQVTLETHSVNLDFDIAKVAVLTNSFGIPTGGQATWEGTSAGGHHRKGVLLFQKPLEDDVSAISLNFKDIAGIPVRTFEEKVKL